jgi:hypothetical protein
MDSSRYVEQNTEAGRLFDKIKGDQNGGQRPVVIKKFDE